MFKSSLPEGITWPINRSPTEATDRAITRDGWLRSGDLGYQDEEGFLYIKDRCEFTFSPRSRWSISLWVILVKDIIIRGGENIVCVF